MTTISWTGSPPMPTMSGRERLWRGKARLSICDALNRCRRNGAGPLLVQCEQGAIVAHVIGVQNRHGPVVQNQPALLMPNGHDRMTYLALFVLHDEKAEIVRKNSQFTQRDIFYDGVVFATPAPLASVCSGEAQKSA